MSTPPLGPPPPPGPLPPPGPTPTSYPPGPYAYNRPIGKPRSVWLTILVSVVTLGIWTWVWSFWNGEELRRYRGTGLGGIAYLLITVFIAPVTMFLMADEVDNLYRQAGMRPRISVLWGLWFLLPLFGPIIWYVRIQESLNQFWQARGGTTSPGL